MELELAWICAQVGDLELARRHLLAEIERLQAENERLRPRPDGPVVKNSALATVDGNP